MPLTQLHGRICCCHIKAVLTTLWTGPSRDLSAALIHCGISFPSAAYIEKTENRKGEGARGGEGREMARSDGDAL